MAILLLSDLHLPDSPSPLREAFLRFLRGPAREAEAVYILGDLFNYWIDDHVGIESYADEVTALQELIAHGVPVYFMPGNRDFIIGPHFFATTGVKLLPDPTLLDFCGQRTLLSHGDRYCTDDVSLQRWRKFSSKKAPQLVWHSLPLSTRRRIALWLRGRSKHKHKPTVSYRPQIMDVNDAAIVQAFSESGAQRLIHGHTHRAAEHAVMADGRNCLRIVLSDWHDNHGEYMECDEQGLRRIPFPISGSAPR
jgi:UDP-2,3-diacylglucosamine hydrolase